ncbi:MAG: ABC transporter ATP-binding protein [Bdellovibrionales bacterium]|nr:ABC transporter ATP-binding protein [Bdellovibrionales bacterium]
MNEKCAIEFRRAEWSASGKLILKPFELKIQEGKCVGVVGHNGAGKTTLFHLLFGLKIPSRGEIIINGVSSLDPRARLRASYLPERPYFNLDQTLSGFLSLQGTLFGITPKELVGEVQRVASEVGLLEKLDSRLKTFSKGMLQKTALAQLSIGSPNLMVLDEPMSGLDPESREKVRLSLAAWKSEGKTLLFSSHSLEDVEQLADLVLVLADGEMKFFGGLSEWRNKS